MAKLKSQIVESPEELKNEMEKMKESIKNIKISKVGGRACYEGCLCLMCEQKEKNLPL